MQLWKQQGCEAVLAPGTPPARQLSFPLLCSTLLRSTLCWSASLSLHWVCSPLPWVRCLWCFISSPSSLSWGNQSSIFGAELAYTDKSPHLWSFIVTSCTHLDSKSSQFGPKDTVLIGQNGVTLGSSDWMGKSSVLLGETGFQRFHCKCWLRWQKQCRPSRPMQSVIYFLSLFSMWTSVVNRVIQYVVFVPGFFSVASCFQIHSCCRMCQKFVQFVHFVHENYVIFIISWDYEHLVYFQFLAIMYNSVITLHTSFCVDLINVFISLGYIHRGEIAGLYSSFMLNF